MFFITDFFLTYETCENFLYFLKTCDAFYFVLGHSAIGSISHFLTSDRDKYTEKYFSIAKKAAWEWSMEAQLMVGRLQGMVRTWRGSPCHGYRGHLWISANCLLPLRYVDSMLPDLPLFEEKFYKCVFMWSLLIYFLSNRQAEQNLHMDLWFMDLK